MAALLAYDAGGNVVATLDSMVVRTATGDVVGLVDFGAHERDGQPLAEIWTNDQAVGSGTWPEFLGGRAHEFRVELEPGWSRTDPNRSGYRIRALLHRFSGQRRERAEVEQAIAAVLAKLPPPDERTAADQAAISPALAAVVGAPGSVLPLDAAGRTRL
jgi:hypothetical protein